MKNLIKKICLISTILVLSSCGTLNNTYIVGYNVVSSLTPHQYKVKRNGENGFPQNNKSIVSLHLESEGKATVDTLWRRVNKDGTFSERMHLTYIDPFRDERVESMIEPGTYFLDGLSFTESRGYSQYFHLRSGAYSRLYSNKQQGWNEKENKALWFSFTVKPKEELIIPKLIVSGDCRDGSSGCENEDFELYFQATEDLKNKKEGNYQLGYQAKLK